MIDIKKKKRRWLWGLYLVLSPFVLFFILATVLYLPPVQRFIVEQVADSMEESTGVRVSVEKVRLAFPLDLAVHGFRAEERGITLANVSVLRLSVPLWPLFKGIVNVDGVELHDAQLNTGEWVPDVAVRGTIGKLSASTHGIDLKKEMIHLDELMLSNARLFVALSDTAVVVEDEGSSHWKIDVPKVKLDQTHISLSMPGDSMRVDFGAQLVLLRNGNIDMEQGKYQVSDLNLKGGDLTYATRSLWCEGIYGNAAYKTSDSAIWMGVVPVSEGLDPNFIKFENLHFALKNISYDDIGMISASLSHFAMSERSGMKIDQLAGLFEMKGDRLSFSNGKLCTPTSVLLLEAKMRMDSVVTAHIPDYHLHLEGKISMQDVQTLGRGFVEQPLLDALPDEEMEFYLNTRGEQNHFSVDTFALAWKSVLNMKAQGEIIHPALKDRMGHLGLDLRTYNATLFHKYLHLLGLDDYYLPNLSLTGKVQFNGDNYVVDLRNQVAQGRLTLKGKFNLATERYQAQLVTKDFPLQYFMPEAGFIDLSTSLKVAGRSFNPLLPSATNDMEWSLDSLKWSDWQLGQLRLVSHLSEGKGQISFGGDNDLLSGEGLVDLVLGDQLEIRLTSDIPTVELARLMGLKHVLTLGSSFGLDIRANRDFSAYKVLATLENTRFITEDKGIPVCDIRMDFGTSDEKTMLELSSGDLNISGTSEGNMDRMLVDLEHFAEEIAHQISSKALNQKSLKAAVPNLEIQLSAGKSNPLFNLCRELGYSYEHLVLNLGCSPVQGVNGDCRVSAFVNGDMILDTINLQLRQDTSGLVANGWVKNFKKRNKNKFEAHLKSYLLDTAIGAEFKILNRDGVVGMDFGILAGLVDDGVNIHLYPEHPVIAFRNFTVNKENFFLLGKDSIIRSDIELLAEDGTGLRIYSQPSDTVNDLTVSLNRFNLEGISGIFPSLPMMSGMLSCDFHIIDDGNEFSAMATMSAENLTLQGAELGNIEMEGIYLPKSGGEHHVNLFTSVQGNEVLNLEGVYCSALEREGFVGKANLLDFPMELVNGFMVETDVAMKGKAAGNLVLSSVGELELNGEIRFSQAHLYSDVYGFDFRMDDQPVIMKDNKLVLTDYKLYSLQETNPLSLNGTLDMNNLSDVRMDFYVMAKNFELINAKKQSSSLVYGRVYADFYGSMKGSLDDMSVKGKLSILDRTDMTYVLKDSPLTVDDRLHDLVQFVDFEEGEPVEEVVVTPLGNFNMTLAIDISNAALFHCNLSEDGSNYVDLEGGGELTLRLTQQGDMRLTGRFTANSGEMKYSLPVVPLKTFKLVRGSYVDFTGDIENPTLNIAAKERMKAIVTENDQPRSVAFDVGVSITQPLNRMGLEFTIEAPEDLAVQNQLTAMTKAERGKAAVGMLATGLYLTDESMSSAGTGFKASNALTAFLQSEIQNIAGSALKTIDLTIGMENNMTSTGATTTDYSFQFAKRFWGNRIAVIVGGKVSTGAEADNSAESFIDNIAVEYRLDKTASRYVRVFYERSYQDPLEGQLTKTGAGLVLRRKSDKLGDLFIFRNNNSGKEKSSKKEKK